MRYLDEPEQHSVDLVKCDDSPWSGYTTYSTVSLHLFPNMLEGDDVRVELAGVAETGIDQFPNLISTAAFYVIKDRWLAAPGVVFPDLLREYDLRTRMEHLMWAPPFAWETLRKVAVSSELAVHWLLAIPIYESERRFLLDRGYFEFEDLLEREDTQYFDLGRPPVA
jgi:hypothetical protein